IMEVYLNIAETGIGTYGVNAGSIRYFDHDASAMSRTEAARIAAVLPLPKKRGATAPKGFTRRYGNAIAARIGVVARDGLDRCVYEGSAPAPEREPEAPAKRRAAPKAKAPPPPPAALPGEEYEQAPVAEAPAEAEPAPEPEPEPVAEANAQ
ncbi:MAG TPA: transglycosylase domain-containing protein, partial [Allosphingosinicella sp.]|nr:transglycosylase domain-containing protein [Allosphingosinicella sp.]